ncbi:MAG: Fur family transcriptional regulator [Solirubrobacteraceae bacterium]
MREHFTHHEPDLAAMLHARGLRVTSQRLVILDALRRLGRHCTAEEIGRAVRDELPACSAPTLYATLDLLVQMGLVRRLDAGLGVALYDAGTRPHHHAVCRVCGAVQDIEGEIAPEDALRSAAARGFEPERAELMVYGVCGSCRQASRESAPAR